MRLFTICLALLVAGCSRGPNPQVLMQTSMGPIKIELYESAAPITVKNFLRYTDEEFYDGTIFHRVMSDFMIQGGGFVPGMKEKDTHEPIKNESFNGLSNTRGTVAMARTPDPDSASAQFFINVVDNAMLDRNRSPDRVGYAVFGKVIEGMDVVDKIRAVETGDRGGHENVPVEDVIIKSVRRVEQKKE
jgi:cyclophilin family peptidyl-prolyl cis-trans isomerase